MVRENDILKSGDHTKSDLHSGYSVARIKSFTPEPRKIIKKIDSSYDVNTSQQVEGESVVENEVHKTREETSEMAVYFIAEVWAKVQDWVKRHPPGLALPLKNKKGDLVPVSGEEFLKKLKLQNHDDIPRLLYSFTEPIFLKLTEVWAKEKETNVDDKMHKAYERYKILLKRGLNQVSDEFGEPIELPMEHIMGGLSTGQDVIFSIFKILAEVYKNKYGKYPSKERLKNLVIGAKSLVLTIAQSDVQTLGAIQDALRNVDIFSKKNTDGLDFNPDKFSIMEHHNNLSLEIKQKVLDQVEKSLKSQGHSVVRTGCPALFAEGVHGKNVLSELYDWFVKLFEEFYINREGEFE